MHLLMTFLLKLTICKREHALYNSHERLGPSVRIDVANDHQDPSHSKMSQHRPNHFQTDALHHDIAHGCICGKLLRQETLLILLSASAVAQAASVCFVSASPGPNFVCFVSASLFCIGLARSTHTHTHTHTQNSWVAVTPHRIHDDRLENPNDLLEALT